MIDIAKPIHPAAIEVRDLRKVYGRVHALRGVDLAVEPGQIFGLLGPNGAGKSTLVKILLTIVRPGGGTVRLLGCDPHERAVMARVGYLPENPRMPRYLTGRQALHYYAALSKTPRRLRRRRAEALLDRLSLTAAASRRLGTYSKGMLQRIGIAQALMHDPQLLLLDEPTDGLDPLGRREVRLLLEDLRRQGRTVLLNSHLLGDVERVCDRVAILSGGRIVRQGRMHDLDSGRGRYVVRFELGPGQASLPAKVFARGFGEAVRCVDGHVEVASGRALDVQPVLDAARAAGLVVAEVRRDGATLEDLFVQIVAESGGEGSVA